MMIRTARPLSEIGAEPVPHYQRRVDSVCGKQSPNADALLLGPWSESVFAYEPAWSRLAETTHLVAIDLPGFGRSRKSFT